MKLTRVGVVALLALGCSGTDEPCELCVSSDGGGGSGGHGGTGAGGEGGTRADVESFSELDAWLRSRVAEGQIHGYAVQVFDASDAMIFESFDGVCGVTPTCPPGAPPFTPETTTGVASSSKWVTSSVVVAAIEELVAAGQVSSLDAGLDAPIGAVLPCAAEAGRGATVTMRQLLSFTDGLIPEHPCTNEPGSTLQSCACTILSDSAAVEVASATDGDPRETAQPPGSVYKYGGAHHAIAAAVVERVTGEPFPATFGRLVRAPLGMHGFYSNETNLAGSFRSSVADYAKFVRAMYHDGEGAGLVLSSTAVAEQEEAQVPPGAVIRISPQPDYQYGLNLWRFCSKAIRIPSLALFEPTTITADPTCAEVHQTGHGGKGGYQPFIDRKRGIYGVFAMRESSPGNDAEYTNAERMMTATVRLYSGLAHESMK